MKRTLAAGLAALILVNLLASCDPTPLRIPRRKSL